MCGLVGVCEKKPISNRKILDDMRDSMTHRGPDGFGSWWSDNGDLGLAHRRLAIIDLSEAGHQPMEDSTQKYVIIFNGEIYNYKELKDDLVKQGHSFNSKSDTEVLLESYKRWGSKCLDYLNGAFSFAIFDKQKNELFLARDRAGEKPLFIYHKDNLFMFASELKAFMLHPMFSRDLNLDSLDYFFTYGYVAGNKSIFKYTSKLPAAHALTYNLYTGETKVWRYWELPNFQNDQNITLEDLTDELEKLLINSVKHQLMADVPTGILLSGGLDSSIITAIASQNFSKIKTFNISFPNDENFDESKHAKMVADYFSTDHTTLNAKDSSFSDLENLAMQFDEPIADHSIVPTSALAFCVRNFVTVALGGDGSDEIFGGYPHYNFVQRICDTKKYMPSYVREIISKFASECIPTGFPGRNHIIGFNNNNSNSISSVNIYFDYYTRRKLLAPLYRRGFEPKIIPEKYKQSKYNNGLSVFQNAIRSDFEELLTDDYLVKSDRASLMHSLELRAPFLDQKIIEFAFSKVPDHYKITKSGRKILLRKLGQKLLPKEFEYSRKQGLTLPLHNWFKSEWGNYLREILFEADINLFDRTEIKRLFKNQEWGLKNTNRLFALCIFEIWRRNNKVNLG